jgi:uncharacterized alkaline shock family protein YloU
LEKIKRYEPIPKKLTFDKEEIKRIIDQATEESFGIAGMMKGASYLKESLYRLFLLGKFESF